MNIPIYNHPADVSFMLLNHFLIKATIITTMILRLTPNYKLEGEKNDKEIKKRTSQLSEKLCIPCNLENTCTQ